MILENEKYCFCGKDVGLIALKWLLKKNRPDLVVVNSKLEKEIINFCKKIKLNV